MANERISIGIDKDVHSTLTGISLRCGKLPLPRVVEALARLWIIADEDLREQALDASRDESANHVAVA